MFIDCILTTVKEDKVFEYECIADTSFGIINESYGIVGFPNKLDPCS
jgi:hypothetical protein